LLDVEVLAKFAQCWQKINLSHLAGIVLNWVLNAATASGESLRLL
jgi:hypothetical protein